MDFSSLTDQIGISSLTAFQAENEALPDLDGDKEAAAKKFEALLATMLVKEMRKTLPKGFFGDGPGSDSFNGWLDKSIGDNLASSWDVNIAGMVKTSLDAKQARSMSNSNATGGGR